MPGKMDGIALTYAIKQVRPSLPVVLLSSHLDPETTHAGEAFMEKPYHAEELLKLVEQLVGTEWQKKLKRPTAS